jgi:hypothetical protein
MPAVILLCSPACDPLRCRRRPNPPTTGSLRGVLRYLRLETFLVLLGAFFINLCVICVFAEGFYGTGAAVVPLNRCCFHCLGTPARLPPPNCCCCLHVACAMRSTEHLPRHICTCRLCRPGDWAAGGRRPAG